MKFRALIKKSTKIIEAIRLMSSSDKNKHIAGIVVVVDEDSKVIGVVSDGDIRRGLASGESLQAPVENIASTNPVVVNSTMTKVQMRKAIVTQAKKRHEPYQKFDKIIVVDDDFVFQDVLRLGDIIDEQVEDKIVAIYGLGFVGLTLASVLANNGLHVIGVDSNKSVIEKLRAGKAPFFENGLESMLLALEKTNPLRFLMPEADFDADIYVITVGTPIDAKKTPIMTHVIQVTETIAKRLKKNNTVIYRSTLPVGTTRQVLIPILETSGLTAGKDFSVAFAPERTVEGNALEELQMLPQVIGGVDRESYERSAKLFSKITNTIVEMETLEAAEMVKLLNNTFRDLVFSFSNEVATLCDQFNLNAFHLIESANEGYPRNRIPTPSPGVGGPCLSKDSYLYTNPSGGAAHKPILGEMARSINSKGHLYVLDKIQQFGRLAEKNPADMKIFIIGFAFKGMPETSDLRDSVACELLNVLPNRSNVFVKDFVVSPEAIRSFGCQPIDNILDGFKEADVVLVLNNHYLNNRFNVIQAMELTKKPVLFFDGWNLFNQKEMERIAGVCYSTMGYLTKEVSLEGALQDHPTAERPVSVAGKP